jgi:hypothetical protein
MKITRQIVVFDAADLTAVSTFWAGLLGGTVVADDDWHSILVDGEWRLAVQLAPDHVQPETRSACAGADPVQGSAAAGSSMSARALTSGWSGTVIRPR